jgi:hypothetical protein
MVSQGELVDPFYPKNTPIRVRASLATGPPPNVSRRFRYGYPSKSSFTTTCRDGYPIRVIALTAKPTDET